VEHRLANFCQYQLPLESIDFANQQARRLCHPFDDQGVRHDRETRIIAVELLLGCGYIPYGYGPLAANEFLKPVNPEPTHGGHSLPIDNLQSATCGESK